MHFIIKPEPGLEYKVFPPTSAPDLLSDSLMLYGVEHEPTFGFTVGIVSNLRLSEYLDLRFIPSLSFGERYLNFSIMRYIDGVPELLDIQKKIPSTYVDLPFHIKYKSQRYNNFRAYMLTGAKFSIDLASESKRKKDDGLFLVKLKKYDTCFEIGGGFDFYFEWFKFGTELKMSYGLYDLLKRENVIYTDGIQKMNSKIFQLSFTFE